MDADPQGLVALLHAYHEVNELDRAVGYAGSRRKADFTFSQDQIVTLVIHPLDPQERRYAHSLARWQKKSTVS